MSRIFGEMRSLEERPNYVRTSCRGSPESEEAISSIPKASINCDERPPSRSRRVFLNPANRCLVDSRDRSEPLPRPAALHPLVGDPFPGRAWRRQGIVSQELDDGRHEPVGRSGPTVFPIFEASRAHANLAGSLLLLQSEVQPALQDVVANVLQLLRIAGKRPSSLQLPPKSGVRNSANVGTPGIRDGRACVRN